jgi:AraC-like DNA-binding protein
MHRRLAAEGASFQQIKTQVRRDLASYYLASTDLDLGWISRRVGFAEQSAFTAFCRKWLADAPSRIRQRARGRGRRNQIPLSETNKLEPCGRGNRCKELERQESRP